MSDYPDWWYRREARKLGTPYTVLDDAIQEMKIAVWLGRPAAYACIDFLRREFGRKPLYIERLTVYPTTTIDWFVDWLDFIEGLAALPDRWRKVIALYAWGYRDVEISKMLKCSDRRIGQIRQQVRLKMAS